MYGIITCSADENKAANSRRFWSNTFAGHEVYQHIMVMKPASMVEGYLKGESRLHPDVDLVIYAHDDMCTVAENFPVRLRKYFLTQGCDVVGGAGSNRAIGDKWFLAGISNCFGAVANLVHPGSPIVRNRQVQTVDLQQRIQQLSHQVETSGEQTKYRNACQDYLNLQNMRGTLIGTLIEMQQQAMQGKQPDQEKAKNLQNTLVDLDKQAEVLEKAVYSGATTRIIEQETVPNQQPFWGTAVFGVPRRLVKGIQLLDGFFIAAKRGVLHWDQHYKHFHLYDLDVSFDAYRRGLTVAVANDLELIHMSVGSYQQPEWKVAADQFLDKWKAELPPPGTPGIAGTSVSLQTGTPFEAFRIVERMIQQSEGGD
jgi:hypothetical protein